MSWYAARRFHDHIFRHFGHLYLLVLWITWLLVSANHEANEEAGSEDEYDSADSSTYDSSYWKLFIVATVFILNI